MLPAGECATTKVNLYKEALDRFKDRVKWLDGRDDVGAAERSLLDTVLFSVDTEAPNVFTEGELLEASRLLGKTIDGMAAFDSVIKPGDSGDSVSLIKLADERLYRAALKRHEHLEKYVVKRVKAVTGVDASSSIGIVSSGESSVPKIKFLTTIVMRYGPEMAAAETSVSESIPNLAKMLAEKMLASGTTLPAGVPTTLTVDWMGNLKIMFYQDFQGGMQCFSGDVTVPASLFDDWIKKDLGFDGIEGCEPPPPKCEPTSSPGVNGV